MSSQERSGGFNPDFRFEVSGSPEVSPLKPGKPKETVPGFLTAEERKKLRKEMAYMTEEERGEAQKRLDDDASLKKGSMQLFN